MGGIAGTIGNTGIGNRNWTHTGETPVPLACCETFALHRLAACATENRFQ